VPEAEERLLSLPKLTQKRILGEINRLARRRRGRPIKLFDAPFAAELETEEEAVEARQTHQAV